MLKCSKIRTCKNNCRILQLYLWALYRNSEDLCVTKLIKLIETGLDFVFKQIHICLPCICVRIIGPYNRMLNCHGVKITSCCTMEKEIGTKSTVLVSCKQHFAKKVPLSNSEVLKRDTHRKAISLSGYLI